MSEPAEPTDPLQVVRLFRLARECDLSELSRDDLHVDLMRMVESVGLQEASQTSDDLQQDPPKDDRHALVRDDVDAALMFGSEALSATVTEEMRRGASSAVQSAERHFGEDSRENYVAALEIKLRQLAQTGAPWDKMAPLALKIFAIDSKPAFAARLVELAFLHGKSQDVADLVAKFRKEAPNFYPLIHPGVRTHLVTRLFAQNFASVDLSAILFAHRDGAFLQPSERLYLLLTMLQSHDRSQTFMFFHQHYQSLATAVQMVGASFGLSLGAFHLKMAHVAHDLGFNSEARELLEAIQKDSPERDEALVLLLRIDSALTNGNLSPYAAELNASPGDRTRLDRLAYYLSTTRNLGGHRDKNRAGLNEILRRPLQWFGEDPEIWSTLSHLLTNCRDLEPLLPNVWELFRTNVVHWYSPSLDAALWAGPLGMECLRPVDSYWQGVAKLHQYINSSGVEEGALWDARELVYSARQNLATKTGLLDWQELHREAFSRVAKSPYLSEPERAKMLADLRLASPDTSTSLADVEQYLNQTPMPTMVTLDRLIQIAQTKKAPGLEFRILLSRGFLRHLTNADLGRLWSIACERKEHDLAWRVATVLRGRGALAKIVVHPWEISGEKRSQYQFLRPSWSQLGHACGGWPKQQQKLAKAILQVGPLLPELLAIVDHKSSSVRVGAAPHDSVESHIDHALGQLEWLPPQRRRYVLSYDQAGDEGDIPAFAQVMPANPWSMLVIRLSHRLGLNVWRWRLSFLAQQIVDVIPRLASSRSLSRHSSKVAKWLRALTPEQRTAWHDLSALASTVSDEEALLCLGKLTCRIATLMLTNHAQALASLVSMRAPVALIWDLEQFILSPVYSEYRQITGISHKVPVPNSLLALSSAVEVLTPVSERVSS